MSEATSGGARVRPIQLAGSLPCGMSVEVAKIVVMSFMRSRPGFPDYLTPRPLGQCLRRSTMVYGRVVKVMLREHGGVLLLF